MPIRFPDPPPEISAALGRVGKRRWPLRGATLGEREAVPAHPIFTVGLEDLLRAPVAEQAVMGPPSWRFARIDREGRGQVVELAPGGGDPVVATGDDRFSAQIREALATAGTDPRLGAHEYESRLLRIPALSLLTLWLHAGDAIDLFVPTSRPAGFEARVYDDQAFMAAVRTAAELVLAAFHEADQPDQLG
jgi:hypothetical protein